MKSEKRIWPNMEPWTNPLKIGAKLENSFPFYKNYNRVKNSVIPELRNSKRRQHPRAVEKSTRENVDKTPHYQ
jgi:hypothetical protein